MARILVSGLINLETTLRVDAFPLKYYPVDYPFFGVQSTISGVGYNIAKALSCLGDQVDFLSMVGQGPIGSWVRESLRRDGISDEYVLGRLKETPQSVILYDPDGKRQIHVDLKDIQEQDYPAEVFLGQMQAADCLALCNINFSRPFLKLAREAGKLIATDIHAVSRLEDDYNRDFMQNADILFMSDELLPVSPEAWAGQVMDRYHPEILVIGLGAQGALLCTAADRSPRRFPAVHTRSVVSTIGAGDALFSAFLHGYLDSGDPVEALQKAMLFASYKIGTQSASEGFLDHQALNALYNT